jgi:hypothetical protein
MEETKRTDKTVLVKGLKYLGITTLLMFLGPGLLYVVLSNSDKAFYVPLLIMSLLICLGAIVMFFLSIKTILDSMFKN